MKTKLLTICLLLSTLLSGCITPEVLKNHRDRDLCKILSNDYFPEAFTKQEIYNIYKEICSRNLVCTNVPKEYQDEISNICKLNINIDDFQNE